MARRGTGSPVSTGFEIPLVRSVEDTGLDFSFLCDLVLKLLYYRGSGISGYEISDAIALPFTGVLEPVMDFLKTEAPFWKKAWHGDDGHWVEARQSDRDARARWSDEAD